MANSSVWMGIAACVAVGACGGFNSDGIGSGSGDSLATASETQGTSADPGSSSPTIDSAPDSADTSTSPSTSATTSPSTTVDPDTSGTTSDPSGGSSDGGDDSTSTDASMTTSGMVDPTTDGGGDDVCAPNGSDSACFACARMSCCAQLMACQGDAPCECVIGCYEGGGDPFGCFDVCGVNAANQALAQCVGGSCEACL